MRNRHSRTLIFFRSSGEIGEEKFFDCSAPCLSDSSWAAYSNGLDRRKKSELGPIAPNGGDGIAGSL